MRYTKKHKLATRQHILMSAHRLFAARGFGGVSIDDIMKDYSLTRGGFYAHFKSKSELYREAVGVTHSRDSLTQTSANQDDTPDQVLRDYTDETRQAFLAEDAASLDPGVRLTYLEAFREMCVRLLKSTHGQLSSTEDSALSVSAMIVGALAVARTSDDPRFKQTLLLACRQSGRVLLEHTGGPPAHAYLWSPPQTSSQQ